MCDTTLNDEKYEVRYTGPRPPIGKNMTDGTLHVHCSDQPEAFALDLGDDQSLYLFEVCNSFEKCVF